MRNISTVQRPMPLISVNVAMISSSLRGSQSLTLVTTFRQINNIRRLGTGQTRCSQAVNRSLCDQAGSGEFVVREQHFEPFENCAGSLAVQLLVNDGMREGLKRRKTPRAQSYGPDLFDQPRHHWIGTQMGDGASAHGPSFYTGFLSRRAVFIDSNRGDDARRANWPDQRG
jgi:hypothetical protein